MTTATPTSTRPRPLSLGHFRKVSANGFGDGQNSYAWSCAWFKDHLYIGTLRNALVVAKLRIPLPFPASFHPVPLPETDEGFDRRGQIWRYSPKTGVWERVYRSPLVPGLEGRIVPLASSFRNMGVFQGKSDPAPALYTIPGCPMTGIGPVLLRSQDGVTFDVVSEPGLGLGDSNVVTYRGVVPFKGWLYIAPASGRGGANINTSYNLTIRCSDDPLRSTWEVSNPDRFGDPNLLSIFDMTVCGNFLYAAVVNIREGFQIWKTDGEGRPPHRWTRVVDKGADRGGLNQGLACIMAFGDVLYAGTGIQGGGYDRLNNVGPAGAEILRFYPDDTWDLVMGDPRMTRSGFKTPSSGYSAGFDSPTTGYVWRFRAHEGVLYAGTFDSNSLFPFIDKEFWAEPMRRLLDRADIEWYMRRLGGCELWRTTNGDDWAPVTRNGFSNPFNWGVRALLSTPVGLFVGTANPYGPKVAVWGPAGWRYEPNPLGGTEIWHGAFEHAGAKPAEDERTRSLEGEAWSDEDKGIPYAYLTSLVSVADARAAGTGDDTSARIDFVRYLTDIACPDEILAQYNRFAIREGEEVQDAAGRADPLRRLAAVPLDLVGLAEEIEDELAAYFAGELRNVGYWRDEAWPPRRACEQLLVELLAFHTQPPATNTPATPPEAILVIDPRPEELAAALRTLRPTARVTTVAPQTALESAINHSRPERTAIESTQTRPAPAASDVVLWVEGPGATDRGAALSAVLRLLKPGGRLLATDLIGSLPGCGDRANPVCSLEQELTNAGFTEVRVVDATRESWARFWRHSREYFAAKLLFQQIDRARHEAVLAALPGGRLEVAAYLFLSALKPRGAE